MALPDVQRKTTPTSRTTGISAEAIAAGANYLGSEIDFSTILDTFCDIEIKYTNGVAPAAGKYLEVFLLVAMDDTNYEIGDATPTDPMAIPVGTVRLYTNTTADRIHTIKNVPLGQYKTKVLIKSESDQSCTVTATLKSWAFQQTDT